SAPALTALRHWGARHVRTASIAVGPFSSSWHLGEIATSSLARRSINKLKVSVLGEVATLCRLRGQAATRGSPFIFGHVRGRIPICHARLQPLGVDLCLRGFNFLRRLGPSRAVGQKHE